MDPYDPFFNEFSGPVLFCREELPHSSQNLFNNNSNSPKKKLDENHQARNGVSQKYLGDCKISWHSTQNKFLFTSHYTPSAYKHIPFCT